VTIRYRACGGTEGGGLVSGGYSPGILISVEFKGAVGGGALSLMDLECSGLDGVTNLLIKSMATVKADPSLLFLFCVSGTTIEKSYDSKLAMRLSHRSINAPSVADRIGHVSASVGAFPEGSWLDCIKGMEAAVEASLRGRERTQKASVDEPKEFESCKGNCRAQAGEKGANQLDK
jgi:hypothetical protein